MLKLASLTVFYLLLDQSSAFQNPAGCGLKPPVSPGQSTKMFMTVHDPATNEDIEREYHVNLPANYDSRRAYPVIIWFHGWSRWVTLENSYVELG